MGLRPSLSQAIGDMGFTEPTPIQRRAMPEALSGRDMVGLAQTGTGKTLAFVVAGLQRLLDSDDRRHRPRMLVVTPVRELAVQVAEHAEQLARHTDLRVASVYGGANMRAQTSAL
jgi:superfamily II DNA/RNA helicase